ncbi:MULTISPECIES: IclR family transcriptional regulator [Phyllobacteriaceae]|jgi:DNA-binding IclR family transcriptional regulator|uniref:IclR family transcriptional regulator n=1 Tax=Ollibium composti TaxID=2675109 RepID=A0ABY2Q5E9_9HYPH|nr:MULTISPECIES: IclR family transcriptional regulator [Mesorhizobium]QDC00771.1 IclR family transcriptional regulator [Mesorhizobium sp. 8]THF55303.1 IclR family transcriptional regulator [Mesorhizobium composti]
MTIKGRGVQSIEVGGRILTALAAEGHPMMLRDLAQKSDLTPAQAHAYLLSFRRLGLVEQDDAGRYRIGPFALNLGIVRMYSFDPLKIATQHLSQLSEETGMMAMIVVLGTRGPTVIYVEEGASQLHVNVRAGTHYSMMGTASGRVFAAYLPQKMVRDYVDSELKEGPSQFMVGAPTSIRQIEASNENVRATGFATTEGVPVPGIHAVSAPVFDHTGQIQLVITLIGPAGRLTTATDGPYVTATLAFCARISSSLGYDPNAERPGTPGASTGPGRQRRQARTAQRPTTA